MRWLYLFCLALLSSRGAVSAQEQERTLIDRLLRPNMELHDRAQSKAFTADSKVVSHQQAITATFATEPAPKQKIFNDTRVASTKEFSSSKADLRSRSVVEVRDVDVHHQIGSSSARDVRPAYDADLAVSGRNYAEDQRAFREQGKSQKSLSRKNPPLTIDQVRELLNKNK